jgi:hypothetical protein
LFSEDLVCGRDVLTMREDERNPLINVYGCFSIVGRKEDKVIAIQLAMADPRCKNRLFLAVVANGTPKRDSLQLHIPILPYLYSDNKYSAVV